MLLDEDLVNDEHDENTGASAERTDDIGRVSGIAPSAHRESCHEESNGCAEKQCTHLAKTVEGGLPAQLFYYNSKLLNLYLCFSS